MRVNKMNDLTVMRVKQLEWLDYEYSSDSTSTYAFQYDIRERYGAWVCILNGEWLYGSDEDSLAPSREAAKLLCQEDFEQRVKSCLEINE